MYYNEVHYTRLAGKPHAVRYLLYTTRPGDVSRETTRMYSTRKVIVLISHTKTPWTFAALMNGRDIGTSELKNKRALALLCPSGFVLGFTAQIPLPVRLPSIDRPRPASCPGFARRLASAPRQHWRCLPSSLPVSVEPDEASVCYVLLLFCRAYTRTHVRRCCRFGRQRRR